MQKLRSLLRKIKQEMKGMIYAKIRFFTKINSRMVLYESFWGKGLIDNPYALFVELLHRKEFQGFLHVWVLDDFAGNAPSMERYREYPNVRFVRHGSLQYIKALSEAKYLVNNTTFSKYFTKKPEQVYINTWHGTPIKSMGYEAAEGSLGVSNTMRNFLCADYLLSANDMMTSMYLESYKLQGILPGEIVEEGYPRNDFLFHEDRKEVYELLMAHGISVETGKQIVLFAPTWREVKTGVAVINPDELLEVKSTLERYIDTDQYQILIKPHQLVYQKLKDRAEYKGLLIPSTIDTNTLLSVVDVLISDFSSIFLDYLILRRQVLFYIPDLESYRSKRGLGISLEELPGPYSSSLKEVAGYLNKIEEVQQVYLDKYESMRSNVCKYEDGHVSARIVDAVFGGKKDHRKVVKTTCKKKLLIAHSGIYDNGISQSFLGILEQMDYKEWDVTAFFLYEPQNAAEEEGIRKVNEQVRVLVNCGSRVVSLGEELRRVLVTSRGFSGPWKWIFPTKALQREFVRCFGMAEFDYIVDFNGYNSMLSTLLLQGKGKKSIWLHNDMKADMNKTVDGKKKNYQSVHFAISLYPQFDHLVSCGHAVMEVNRKNLATSKTYHKFTWAKNTVNIERIRDGIANWEGQPFIISEKHVNFVTMGRMSTEKNHRTLIDAFAKLHREYENTKLYILGDGPLRQQIVELIRRLGLEDDVVLTGSVGNPFGLMTQCDCFILPSLHEGQPMVLLEARVCGLPIIVSNFSTVSDSLYPNGQLLIGNDEESIYKGLCEFMDGKVPVCEFCAGEYNQEAYEEFIRAVE